MQKVLSVVACTLLAFANAFAGNNNSYMVHDVPWWNSKTYDNLTNVLMEVTPRGLYADIELTFTMKANNLSTGPTDSTQGVLNFELPPNSYIHDSWLWLNDSIVIRAAITERNKAIQVYSGYIQRRQDPSLLLKTGTNTYQLNVFPITNIYSRKVKLTFSTLMTQLNGKAMLTLPTDLLTASQTKPDFLLLINNGYGYTQPYFAEANYNSFILGSLNNTDLLSILPGAYSDGRELNLVYNTSTDPRLTIFSTSNNEGVYELQMPAETNITAPRHLNFILDHRAVTSYYYDPIYKFDEIKKMLRTFLLTNCKASDSFNVFYVNNNTVVQAFPGWTSIHPGTVNNLIDNMPNSISSDPGQFQNLLTTAIAFGQTKLPSEEHTILISKNTDYTSLQPASQLYTSVSNSVGGFTNKISVINYVSALYYSTAGSEILFNNFCSGSGGTYYKYTSSFYDGYLSRYTYDLDIRSTLKGILYYMSGGSGSYDVHLPLTAGFTYGSYNLSGTNKHFNWLPYCETGKYYGNIGPGNADITYVHQGNVVTHQAMVNTIDSGSRHQVQSWINNYLLDLESMNNPQLYAEILDSSFRNRVLCYETAFLALENGDTIGDEDDSIAVTQSGSLNVEETETKAVDKVKCFPNPFSDKLTIESPDEISEIEVYDITGRLLFSQKNIDKKTFVWNGLSNTGETMTTGMYIIRLRHKEKTETLKVMKM